MSAQATLLRPEVHEQSLVPLRPYQREALDAVHQARARGVSRQLISMATGSGKTVFAAHLIAETALPKTIFLVHRDELVRQSLVTLQRVNPNLSLGVVKADRDDLYANVVIASAQTLAVAKRLERLREACPGELLLVSDEAHHDAAESRLRAIRTLDPALLVGLTATPNRADKIGLDALYQEVVFHLPMLELIAMGKLSPLKGLRIDTETDIDAVHTSHGDLAEGELADAIDTPGRNNLIVESYQRHCAGRTRTVAFCVNVRHAQSLAAAFNAAGIRAETIFGHTPADERVATLEAFHRGEIPVLVNVMVLSEGYDEPGIDCVLWARPTKSQSLYIQCIGRSARLSEDTGKADALIVDFVDSSSRHRLITLPVLAGKEPQPASEGGGYAEQGELVDLLATAQTETRVRERAAVAVNLFSASEFLWRTVDGVHMAPAGNSVWVALIEEEGGFVPHRVLIDKNGPAMRALFDRPLDIETAFGVGESRMSMGALTGRQAAWRSGDTKPSPAQLDFARKLHIHVPSGLTKGEVSGLIDDELFRRTLRRAKETSDDAQRS